MRKLISIYRTPDGKRKAWTLAYYLHGVRRREKFTTKENAQTRADDLLVKISNGEIEAASMTGSDKASLARARELIGNRQIENVAAEYIEARTVMDKAGLDNIRLINAAEHYVATHAECPDVLTADVVTEMLARKQADECSERWVADLESRLSRFRAYFKCPIAYISGVEIDRWLQKLGVGIRSKKNYRTAISTLMTFAKTRGYLPRDWNELDKVGFNHAPSGRIQVWSPTELERILRTAETHRNEPRTRLVPWIALRAFAGIRFEEMTRLHWSDIQPDVIVLDSHITKTKVRRIIPLQANLKEWLSGYMGEGPVVTRGSIEHVYAEVVTTAELTQRHNALRDSYASYRMAQTGYDKFKVAQECGNSPAKLEQSYRALRTPDGTIITPAVAETYFSIRPKIVTMERVRA